MFQQHERIAEFYRRKFQFILVDEYQDTNKIQADLVDLLARDHRNVMVVGDDAQSIYSWRGANFQNILEFPKRYPDAAVLDRKSTRLNSSHVAISYAVFCLKKKI